MRPTAIGAPGDDDFEHRLNLKVDAALVHERIASLSLTTNGISPSALMEAAMATLDAAMSSPTPDAMAKVIDVLQGYRNQLMDQLELERLVAKPVPKRNAVMRPEDDYPAALENSIGIVDGIIAKLKSGPGPSGERFPQNRTA